MLETELATARTTIVTLDERVAQLESVVGKLQRHVFGQRSEKMPPVAEELRRKGITTTDHEAALAKRRENAEKKKALPAREIPHKIADEKEDLPEVWQERLQASRPRQGNDDLRTRRRHHRAPGPRAGGRSLPVRRDDPDGRGTT